MDKTNTEQKVEVNSNPRLPAGVTIEPQMQTKGWYGCDLDGCLAQYDRFRGDDHIGEPIAPMVAHVKQMLADGKDVRIFTARVSPVTLTASTRDQKEAEIQLHRVITAIYKWMVLHLGRPVPITCQKDYQMICMYDDRCVQMIPNEGKRADGLPL
jgi:hypothetical protein